MVKSAVLRSLAAIVLLGLSTTGLRAATAPSVSITAPAANTNFAAPASVTITANAAATASGATISKVAFYQGTTLLTTKTAAPYTYTWTSVAAGNYSLTAKATDSLNATTTSAAVAIKVNTPPTVSITAPAANATYTSPASISITSSPTAKASGATISKVEFYQGTTLLGTKTASPYTVS